MYWSPSGIEAHHSPLHLTRPGGRPDPHSQEAIMIGMTLFHGLSNTLGKVDATAQHPDGKHLARIDDHWLFLDECKAA